MMRNRKNSVVLVTGSSSGIGRACCERLVASGRIVYGASRSQPTGVAWPQLTMDVTDRDQVSAAVAEVVAREGRIDAVVHSAGVSLVGAFEETALAEARRHFDVNYFGAFHVMQAVLPVMRRQRSGRLLVIGSIGGLIGLPYASQYSATKFALDGMIEAIRPELRAFGIDAAVVHPGDFRTEVGANRLTTAATQPGTPYFEACQRAVAFYGEAELRARTPEPLARVIDALLDRRRVPARVIVGTSLEAAGVAAKRLLPSRLFEYVFSKAYGG